MDSSDDFDSMLIRAVYDKWTLKATPRLQVVASQHDGNTWLVLRIRSKSVQVLTLLAFYILILVFEFLQYV